MHSRKPRSGGGAVCCCLVLHLFSSYLSSEAAAARRDRRGRKDNQGGTARSRGAEEPKDQRGNSRSVTEAVSGRRHRPTLSLSKLTGNSRAVRAQQLSFRRAWRRLRGCFGRLRAISGATHGLHTRCDSRGRKPLCREGAFTAAAREERRGDHYLPHVSRPFNLLLTESRQAMGASANQTPRRGLRDSSLLAFEAVER